MADERQQMLSVLAGNVGFAQPAEWVDYALRYHFRPVRAERVRACPNCGGIDSTKLGQYVYYSTLHGLRECRTCGLVYADARIDPSIVQHHFESTYKDEEYFRRLRAPIFRQLAALVDRHAPGSGRVLDIGGAKGHLMAEVQRRRPDLELTVNDLSRA